MNPSDKILLTWLVNELFRDANPQHQLEFRYKHRSGAYSFGACEVGLFRGNHESSPAWEHILSKDPHAKISFGPVLRVNTLDNYGGKQDLTQAGCFFADADADGLSLADLIQFKPSPTFIVESSPGNYHVYWLFDGLLDVTDDKTLERYEAVQRGIAHALGCKFMNAAQLMMLPLTHNTKYDPPAYADIVFANWRNRYASFNIFPQRYATIQSKQDWHSKVKVRAKGAEAEFPAWASHQLENWPDVASRNQAVYNVSKGLADLGFSYEVTRNFVLAEIKVNADYANFSMTETERCLASAFGHQQSNSLDKGYRGYSNR